MFRTNIAVYLAVLCAVGCSPERAHHVTFEGEISEHKWTLAGLDPDLPSDWVAHEYLVLELRASSPQRFF